MSLNPISADLVVPLQTFINKAFTHSTHTTKTLIELRHLHPCDPNNDYSFSSHERMCARVCMRARARFGQAINRFGFFHYNFHLEIPAEIPHLLTTTTEAFNFTSFRRKH